MPCNLYLEKEQQRTGRRKPAVLLLLLGSSTTSLWEYMVQCAVCVCVFVEGAPVPLSSNATVIGANKEPAQKLSWPEYICFKNTGQCTK